jgi:hypothetical protein
MGENNRSGSKLPPRMSFSTIIRNALNSNYSMDQAATDLGSLMFEQELIRRRGDTDVPRHRELDRLIPMQETLALGRLNGDELFNRLDLLNVRVEKA